MVVRSFSCQVVSCCLEADLLAAVHAKTLEEFDEGRPVTLPVAYSAGGSFDVHAICSIFNDTDFRTVSDAQKTPITLTGFGETKPCPVP